MVLPTIELGESNVLDDSLVLLRKMEATLRCELSYLNNPDSMLFTAINNLTERLKDFVDPSLIERKPGRPPKNVKYLGAPDINSVYVGLWDIVEHVAQAEMCFVREMNDNPFKAAEYLDFAVDYMSGFQLIFGEVPERFYSLREEIRVQRDIALKIAEETYDKNQREFELAREKNQRLAKLEKERKKRYTRLNHEAEIPFLLIQAEDVLYSEGLKKCKSYVSKALIYADECDLKPNYDSLKMAYFKVSLEEKILKENSVIINQTGVKISIDMDDVSKDLLRKVARSSLAEIDSIVNATYN